MARAVVAVSLVLTGCLWERNVDHRLARMQLGANTRTLTMPAPTGPMPTGGTLSRTTEPAPDETTAPQTGVTGSLQFTMRQTRNIYAGGEIEFGPFERHGSYFGGAYAVIGAESRSTRGSVSVELMGGRQWLRYELGAADVPVTVFEPRARGQLALSDQISLGGVIGAGLTGDAGWMAGLYLGFYSKVGAGQ